MTAVPREQEYETPVADCLRAVRRREYALIDSGWECTLRGEVPLLVTARLKNHWLRLCSSLSGQSSSRPTPEILDRMLAQNVKLAGRKVHAGRRSAIALPLGRNPPR